MTPRDATPPPSLKTGCQSCLHDVRALLVQVDSFLRAQAAPDAWVEDMNIILAEVLTNIARHGYRDSSGRIELEIHLHRDELFCHVSDTGRPFDPALSGHLGPDPRLMREGGYGWFLIRSLARALTYERVMGRNRLTFWVPVGRALPVAELAE